MSVDPAASGTDVPEKTTERVAGLSGYNNPSAISFSRESILSRAPSAMPIPMAPIRYKPPCEGHQPCQGSGWRNARARWKRQRSWDQLQEVAPRSIPSSVGAHHVRGDCRFARRIKSQHRTRGTGGYRLCGECAKLIKKEENPRHGCRVCRLAGRSRARSAGQSTRSTPP